MGSRYCSIYLCLFLFPAYVTCWGNYEGSMPDADVQRFLTPTLPVIGSEVKQKAIWNDISYGSVRQPHYRGTHESYGPKESLFVGSNAKSNTKDCQTRAKSGNAMDFKPNSLSKYGSSCGQPSAQYESRTVTSALRNVQGGSRLASVLSQSKPTLMKTLKVPELSSKKLSRGEYSYVAGQNINNVQIASSSFGPLLKGSPVQSNVNPGKHSQGGPSVVSSGPVFVVQGKGSAQGQKGFPDSVKPPVHRHIKPYQGSQTSRDGSLPVSSQGKAWKKPLQYFKNGIPYNPSTELRKPSKNDCKDNVAKSIINSGEVFLKTQESIQRNMLPPYEATYPKFQQVHNTPGLSNQMVKPMYSSQNGAQQNVGKKSTIASSGAVLVQQAPTDSLNGKKSNIRKVYTSFSEHEVTFPSGQTSHQYQPFKVTQNSRNAQPAPDSYASSSQTRYQTFSSLKGTSYKPGLGSSKSSTSVFSATTSNIAGPNEINTVHVRPNKPFASSFGKVQSQRASGDNSRGAFQSSLPSSYLGRRPSEEMQTSVSSSAQFLDSKRVQNQLVETQENTDDTRCITTIPSELGQGAIQRLPPKLSSKYRQVKQNGQERLDFSAPKCDVIQKNPAGLRGKGTFNFQEVNLSV